jgi:hypothetical protein
MDRPRKATGHAAAERHAGLAAEEAAEVAEDLATAARRDRDQALAEAAALAARALEMEARANAQVAQVRAEADARIEAEHTIRIAAQSLTEALIREHDRLVTQAERDAASLAAVARALHAVEDRTGGAAARRA